MPNALQIFYTYLWLREDGTPYYVGKGKGNRAFIGNRHKVPVPPDRSRILIQEFPSEKDALSAEMFLIAYYGRKDVGTGCLRNLTPGGENPPIAKKGTGLGKRHLRPRSEKFRQAQRERMLGNKRGLGGHSNHGQPAWNRGKVGVSSGTHTKMSESAKRRRAEGR
jgi:hypothetical protein